MMTVHEISVLTEADVAAVAELHRTAFPSFFLSSLGTSFLREFYRGFLGDPSAVSLVARDDSNQVRGVAVGTVEPAGFFGRLVRRRLVRFGLASARAALRSPGVTPRLLMALRYRGESPSPTAGALLSSICVDPRSRGSGLGSTLLSRWTQEVAARGGHSAYLTTDAKDNETVNHFYQSAGWRLDSEFVTREGRHMNRYATTVNR